MIANPVEVAVSVARQLCKEALWNDGRCTWTALSFQDGVRQEVQSSVVGLDLYGGTAGIACFLAETYAITGDEIFRATARAAIGRTHDELEAQVEKTPAGLYDGLAGILLATVLVGQVCDHEEAAQPVTLIANHLERRLGSVQDSDVISGHAGVLLSLLWCWRRLGQHRYLELAVLCGERLGELAIEQEGAAGWNSGPSEEQLTGYAHGCAGVALALGELYAATNRPEFLLLSERAINFENRFYREADGNWLDLRAIAGGSQCGLAWCHGAPGILLSRLRLFQITRTQRYIEDARVASETCHKAAQRHLRGAQSDTSLCHGSAGLMLCLWEAGEVLGERRLTEKAEALQAKILADRMTSSCWANAFSAVEDTPQLMLGYTGIGYAFLRVGGLSILSPLHLANVDDATISIRR